jgi:prepilin-type N-terminal cleavage/methylation domain-containing protein
MGTERYNYDKIIRRDIMRKRPVPKTRARGFTLIELLIVIALIGAFALAVFPAINNALRTRSFDNAAKDILVTLQQAKLMAVRTKLNHRLRFAQTGGVWRYLIEQESTSGVWARVSGFIERSIPSDLTATVSLPAQAVTFSALGYVLDFTVNQNSVILESERLRGAGQDDRRIVSVYAGGSVVYAKARST